MMDGFDRLLPKGVAYIEGEKIVAVGRGPGI